MRIHIYNPEHDYALAAGSPYYTPPAEVSALRDRNLLKPLLWANAGDAILIPDHIMKKELFPTPGITLLHDSELSDFLAVHPEAVIEPWGWDAAVRHRLSLCGVPENKMPSVEWVSALRTLSHRRTSILFNEALNNALKKRGLDRHRSPIAEEFHDLQTALDWYADKHEVFFKAPWSSAGRGILYTLELDTKKHIEPWLRGIIRRQGSVMGETYFRKKIDFATEWYIGKGSDGSPDIRYLGLSTFSASNRGKYHNQLQGASGLEIMWVKSIAPDFGDGFIEAQREALEDVLMTQPEDIRYTGYLGVDMMASEEGIIRGGVELNFRHTMGIPPLDVLILGTGNVGTHLFKALKESGVRVGIVSGHAAFHPTADIYIIAVKDEAVVETAERLDKKSIPGSLILHTSGSVSIESLKSAFRDKSQLCGVLYPLQTFSVGAEMNYKEIPFLVEGSGPAATAKIINLAKRISYNVKEADSEERAFYHIAAVLTCNFANHLCSLADDFLKDKGLDFKILLPLLKQTVAKLENVSPADSQTGPAARGDTAVIESHLNHLNSYPGIARIYEMMTSSILDSRVTKCNQAH